MSDLVAFLRARLDEDEATARAATPGPWSELQQVADVWLTLTEPEHPQGPTTMQVEAAAAVYNAGVGTSLDEVAAVAGVNWGTRRHVARHDPARVLADVAAKRALAWLHRGVHLCVPADGPGIVKVPHDGPCPTLVVMVQPYADHPDYDPAWRP